MKRRLLWVGDAACQTGFARCTHETLAVLQETWDVAVLGLNYRGDPHEFPYPIYPAAPGGDLFGMKRIDKLSKLVKPDLIVIQNDPWNFPGYLDQLKNTGVPVVGAVAVDGLNCKGKMLNGLSLAVFWTRFGLTEARQGGFEKDGAIIGLGVDLDTWYPTDRDEARKFLYGNDYVELKDAFILTNVNRNQPRKRLDLTIRYFANWVKYYDVKDAYLHLHVAPTGDANGYDCDQLAGYYGIADKIILADLGAWNGVTDKTLRSIYAAANLQISTTQGEGWGLPTIEGMACGIPQIFGRWSALAEWAASAAYTVPCTSTIATAPRVNSIGGVPDEEAFTKGLDELYRSPKFRDELTADGLSLVKRPEFRWRAIGEKWRDTLDEFMASRKPEAVQEVTTA